MTKRVVMGRQSDGSYGLRCSLPGYDASTNPPDNTQLAFSSDWGSVLPIYLAGTRLGLANGTDTSITFTSLGYIPLGFYLGRPAGQAGWNSLPPPYNGRNVYLVVATYIDHIRIINQSGFTVDIAYSIFSAISQ